MDMVMGSSGSGAGEKSPDAASVAQALSASSFTARTMKPRVTITRARKEKAPMNKQFSLALIVAAFVTAGGAHAAALTEYYNVQPIGGVPQPQVSFALGTDWTLTLSPDALYSQNTGVNAGTSYRTLYGDGNNLLFKFDRQAGDTNAYDVTVTLSGYNQWSGNGSPSMQLLWGTDAFGANDNDVDNHGRVWWSADTANLTQVASNTTEGGFNWSTGSFSITSDNNSAYLMVLGSANSFGYVYSANADFTVVPEPASFVLLGLFSLVLLRRRQQ